MDYIHPIFHNRPAADAKLWRYLSFAKFASLLQSSLLHFTRTDQFDDHFEGAWPLSDLKEWQKIAERGFDVASFTETMKRSRVAASCWFEAPHESAAMWRLYAPGNEGVAISTTFGKLDAVLHEAKKEEPGSLIGAGRVKYLDHFTEGLIAELAEDEPYPNTLLPFMLKNKSYEHEREVRALIIPGMNYEIPKAGCDLPLSPTKFMDEIVVNPFSQRWFIEAVAGVVFQHDLKMKLRRSLLSREMFYLRVIPNPYAE